MKKRIFGVLLLLFSLFAVAEAKVYRVEDVPMVHLADRTRYVSNPDGILSAPSVATIDSLLFALEESTGIQVLVAVLGDIEGGDDHRAQKHIPGQPDLPIPKIHGAPPFLESL